jgi:hypothetical protein
LNQTKAKKSFEEKGTNLAELDASPNNDSSSTKPAATSNVSDQSDETASIQSKPMSAITASGAASMTSTNNSVAGAGHPMYGAQVVGQSPYGQAAYGQANYYGQPGQANTAYYGQQQHYAYNSAQVNYMLAFFSPSAVNCLRNSDLLL